MKKTLPYLILGLNLLTLAFISSTAQGQLVPDRGKILSVNGSATIQFPGDATPQKATPGQPVPEGTRITTQAGSKVMVGLTKGASTLLEENSSLEVDQLKVKKAGNRITERAIQVHVPKGASLSFLEGTGGASEFKVKTPLGIAAARGTIWRSSADSFQVLKGLVRVTLSGGKTVSVPASKPIHSVTHSGGKTISVPTGKQIHSVTHSGGKAISVPTGKQIHSDGTVDAIPQDALNILVTTIESDTNLNATVCCNLDVSTASYIITNATGEGVSSPVLRNPITISDEETNNSTPLPEPSPPPPVFVPLIIPN